VTAVINGRLQTAQQCFLDIEFNSSGVTKVEQGAGAVHYQSMYACTLYYCLMSMLPVLYFCHVALIIVIITNGINRQFLTRRYTETIALPISFK